MDAMTETYLGHCKAIADRQRMLKVMPKVKDKIESEIDKLQAEAKIMKIEIESGKNLS